jgi:hypothetical protein
MTTTNTQVKLLMKKLKLYNQETAAAKAGMDVQTARKYIKSGQLPSEMKVSVTDSKHVDPFCEAWPEISGMLQNAPGLQAKTILNYLLNKDSEHYKPSQLRTLQRRIRNWRAEHGASQSIIFRQDIKPGRQSQSDCTWMNRLNITIGGKLFKHLLFHFMLPYSRWESVKLCFSESFESIVSGFEKAVWELGCIATEHRTDNLTAATKAMGNKREFTERWKTFMAHYGITPTTNNLGVSHENGSVEKSHDTLKTAIDQALLLRGYRDFDSAADYIVFIENVVETRNMYRREALAVEIKQLSNLPDRKWHSPTVVHARVNSSSIIQILDHSYTVPSRLIHYSLKAYVYPDEVVLFYGKKQIQRMPRAHNNALTGLNYRHIIDSLVRKPAAFSQYRYKEALFPRLCFRRAYDALRKTIPANADKNYLKLLQLAKIQSEEGVAEALDLLLESNQTPTPGAVKDLIDVYRKERLDVTVNTPDLSAYDCLLSTLKTTQ